MKPRDGYASIAAEAIGRHYALQSHGDLTAALMLAGALQPAVIVEIGCDAGGTLWAWRQLTPHVIGITLPVSPVVPVHPGVLAKDPSAHGQGTHPLTSHGAKVITADSHEPATLGQLTALLRDRLVDVLFIDGDHTPEGCLADFKMYAPLVRPGGLVLVDDIAHPELDVRSAWETIAAASEVAWSVQGADVTAGIGAVLR